MPAATCRRTWRAPTSACKVRGNANCANKKDPRDYFKPQLLVDTMVLSDEGLRHLVAEVGVGQIVYGTDNPLNWPVTIDLVLNASFLRQRAEGSDPRRQRAEAAEDYRPATARAWSSGETKLATKRHARTGVRLSGAQLTC